MKEAGFNYCRFAARGELYRTGKGAEGIHGTFSLIDRCIEEAKKNDIAISVRLHGYSQNVSGYENVQRIDVNGKTFGPYQSFFCFQPESKGSHQDHILFPRVHTDRSHGKGDGLSGDLSKG